MRRVLLTGATGFLGRELAGALLEQDPEREVWAVVRQTDGRPAAERPELDGLASLSRFHVVAGDVELPGLGLAAERLDAVLPRDLDTCFHLAARTEFRKRQRAQTFRANLDGTRHLVDALECLGDPCKLYYVSTVYVSGTRSGVVDETLHGKPPTFANPYEESKHAAEWVVARSALDWTILRPSILIGHSGTAAADAGKTVYGVLKTYWRLREVLRSKYSEAEIRALSGDPFVTTCRPEVAKNVICVDDAVRLMLDVAARRPACGTVFHLANPHPTSVGELIRSMLSLLDLRCIVLQPLPGPHPRVEDRLIERGTEIYRPYLMNDEALFDQAALRRLIGDRAVDSVLPMTRSRLEFLFEGYLHRQLELGAPVERDDGVDRLAAVQAYGRSVLAYTSAVGDGLAVPLGTAPGFISCAAKGRTAALVGDPVCARDHFRAAVDVFFRWCMAGERRPVAVQVSRAVADALAARGGHCNRMGDEAVIDLASFDSSLSGRDWVKLRRFRNAARAAGVTVREGSYVDVQPALVDRVSRSWLGTKINRRELTVLLRPLPLRDEPGVRKFFAFLGEQLVGFVIFDPLYEAERVIGYYADVERYERQPNGIHDLVLLEAVEVFRREGCRILSLGLAPLHHLEKEDHPSASEPTGDFLRRLRDEVGPVYSFKGVSQHKACYNPRWEPTYFYSQRHDGTSDVLDVLSLIGLLAPEAVHRMRPETFDLVQGA